MVLPTPASCRLLIRNGIGNKNKRRQTVANNIYSKEYLEDSVSVLEAVITDMTEWSVIHLGKHMGRIAEMRIELDRLKDDIAGNPVKVHAIEHQIAEDGQCYVCDYKEGPMRSEIA
jgi:hypothetical protein